ncbi:MAG: hypothetical protein N2745_04450 [Syntrophorhabdaceae bacterium]|nr:hypothetical protein [Syntrophorhabdaceae bacterium]
MGVYNLISFFGIFFLLGVLFLFSKNRRRISIKVVLWGVLLQAIFAFFVFFFTPGKKLFMLLNDMAMGTIESSYEGIRFIFGRLAIPPGNQDSLGFILAFQALPTIIFFAALMELLYFVGIMDRIIHIFSKIFVKVLGISGAEALCASAQIFLGIESNLTVRPYLKEMTESELMVVLTTGMATIASSVLGFYVIILSGTFPGIAGHLISASILLAPAAIITSKILIPETKVPLTMGKVVKPEYKREGNAIEAIINGSMAGVKMVVSICALLISFIGLISILDSILGFLSKGVYLFLKLDLDLSLKSILGYLFYPFTVAIGVPIEDASLIAKVIGERIVATEVKSYQELAQLIREGKIYHERSAVIATYVLCGFAHIPSLAIFVGGTASIVPERTKDISILGLWALFASNIACLLTGAIAGIFFTKA